MYVGLDRKIGYIYCLLEYEAMQLTVTQVDRCVETGLEPPRYWVPAQVLIHRVVSQGPEQKT